MKMDESAKRRRSNSDDSLPAVKVEVKEENVHGNEYLMAKGRFQGVLRQLRDQSDSDSDTSEEKLPPVRKKRKKPETNNNSPLRSTYLMKLYDRSVDLAKFEEDTPLYPICRAWIANNSKKPHPVIKRRLSSPEPEASWTTSVVSDVHRLPVPNGIFVSRIPDLTPEQLNRDKDAINLNYDEKPPVPKSELMKEHITRWNNVKRNWIATAARNEERYALSKHVLQNIYAKAQDSMLGE